MPVYISASGLSDFIKCPQMLFYRITKPFPEVVTKEMKVGKIVHSALERGWRSRDIAMDIATTEASYNKMSKSDIVNIQFDLDIFFLNFRHMVGDGDKVEFSFKLPLAEDVFLIGKIDRISRGNVIDWKTGKDISKNLEHDVQCIIYHRAYKELFGKEPSSVMVASLSTGKLIPYKVNEFYTNEVFSKIIPRMIRTVKENHYERLGIFNHSCFKCKYKEGCLGRRGEDELDSTHPTD